MGTVKYTGEVLSSLVLVVINSARTRKSASFTATFSPCRARMLVPERNVFAEKMNWSTVLGEWVFAATEL